MDFQFILLTTDNARLIDLHTFIGNFLYGVITSIYLFFSLSSFRHNFSTRDDSFSHPQAGIALHQIMNWFLSISIFHSVLTFIAIFIRDHTCPLSLIHTLSLCIVRFDFLWKNNSLNLLRQLKTHTHLL